MCGVLVCAGAGVQPPGWDAALERLSRRGPDGRGTWSAPSGLALLGHARLAIQDLSDAGAQPMAAPGGRIALTYNGEIYNAPDLRLDLEAAGRVFRSRSDTEVLVHGYLEWGFDGLLERIAGMFALAIWDDDRRELLAAVDPAGMKPLTWSTARGRLYAASDCDALRLILPERAGLDAEGLCHVLCHGYCPAPGTVWRGVRKLGPGQALRWRPGEASPTIWRHWSAPEAVGEASPPLEAFWDSVVREHLLSDVPVGLFLSGGLDSAAVGAALSNAGRSDVACFTLALAGADDESPAAAETAAHLGMPHLSVSLSASAALDELSFAACAFDEPQAYGALLTATAVARASRVHGKVMLAGDGGDEAFAGYTWHRRVPGPSNGSDHAMLAARAGAIDADGDTRARALRSLASLSFLHGHLQAVFPRFHPAEARTLLAPLSARYDEHVYAAWASEHDRPGLPWPRRAQRLDLMTFCAGSILPKIDRSSMAVGLELRAPFLDRRVLTWSLSRPVEAGEGHEASKPALRQYLRGRVPPGVLSRPKQGFSLRLEDPEIWVKRLPQVGGSRLVRDGVLAPGWDRAVAPDAPCRNARAFALCMLAAWYEGRA